MILPSSYRWCRICRKRRAVQAGSQELRRGEKTKRQAIKSPHKAGALGFIIFIIQLPFVRLNPSSITLFIIVIDASKGYPPPL